MCTLRITEFTYSYVRSTLDNEAVGETVKANGATLLIQVDLFFRQKVGNSAAGTKSKTKKYTTQNMCVAFFSSLSANKYSLSSSYY